LAGVLVAPQGGDEVILPMIGIDHDSGRAGPAYFNLGYNRPIQNSISKGHRRIYFGKSVYDAKACRGCSRVEKDFYLHVRNGFQGLALRALDPLRSGRIDSMSATLRRRRNECDEGDASQQE
jgi:hypothetical protein